MWVRSVATAVAVVLVTLVLPEVFLVDVEAMKVWKVLEAYLPEEGAT